MANSEEVWCVEVTPSRPASKTSDLPRYTPDPKPTPMDMFTACGIVEGFDGKNHTALEELEAWATLIKSGQVWHLQGWYGRAAQALIDEGVISPEGELIGEFEEVD